ncbi:MAG TPA: ABC transporter ATP-binding protein [Thermoprotei archaeon]|nr:ABC transporter ATP-binding protein [Thermoprotei archaeon]
MLKLQLLDIWKKYGGKWVLKGIDFEVSESEVICIYGENGVGKTTLLKIIAGLVTPTKGKILFNGESSRKYRNRFQGVLLHENILYEELSVEENIRYYSILYRGDGLELVDRLVEALGLKKYWGSRVGTLSYGWRKRANIVKAFLNNPRLLLLDEPFTGLDMVAYKNFLRVLADVYLDRITIFTISNLENLYQVYRDLEIDFTIRELRDGKLHEFRFQHY